MVAWVVEMWPTYLFNFPNASTKPPKCIINIYIQPIVKFQLYWSAEINKRKVGLPWTGNTFVLFAVPRSTNSGSKASRRQSKAQKTNKLQRPQQEIVLAFPVSWDVPSKHCREVDVNSISWIYLNFFDANINFFRPDRLGSWIRVFRNCLRWLFFWKRKEWKEALEGSTCFSIRD